VSETRIDFRLDVLITLEELLNSTYGLVELGASSPSVSESLGLEYDHATGVNGDRKAVSFTARAPQTLFKSGPIRRFDKVCRARSPRIELSSVP
jgi:hypothetical protein